MKLLTFLLLLTIFACQKEEPLPTHKPKKGYLGIENHYSEMVYGIAGVYGTIPTKKSFTQNHPYAGDYQSFCILPCIIGEPIWVTITSLYDRTDTLFHQKMTVPLKNIDYYDYKTLKESMIILKP